MPGRHTRSASARDPLAPPTSSFMALTSQFDRSARPADPKRYSWNVGRSCRRHSAASPTGAAPRAPQLDLESFGGIIQLASRAEIERALLLRQAMRDSAEAARRLLRLRSMRFHERGHDDQDSPKPAEDPDKN